MIKSTHRLPAYITVQIEYDYLQTILNDAPEHNRQVLDVIYDVRKDLYTVICSQETDLW